LARKALYKHATQVNTSSYPDDGSSPVGTNEWNEDPDPNGMLGFTPQTSTVTISSGVATITDSVTVVAAESSTSDTLDKVATTNTNEYDLLWLFADTGDTITLTHTASPSAAGHIFTVSGANETLSTTKPTILIRKGSYWYGYGGGTVSDGSITTAKLAADAVTGAKIADDTIDSEHYAATSIDNEHLADDAVGAAELASDAVVTASVVDLNITTAKIAADAVTAAKLADDAVVTANVVDLNITTGKIAADAITAAKIADDAIDSEHYTDGSVDLAHLSADSVDGSKIADDAIDSEHYTDGSIDTAHIADDQITLAKIASGTDGEMITWDASGNPAAVAVGTATHVLTSNGAGAAPTFQAASGVALGTEESQISGADSTTINAAANTLYSFAHYVPTTHLWYRVKGFEWYNGGTVAGNCICRLYTWCPNDGQFSLLAWSTELPCSGTNATQRNDEVASCIVKGGTGVTMLMGFDNTSQTLKSPGGTQVSGAETYSTNPELVFPFGWANSGTNPRMKIYYEGLS